MLFYAGQPKRHLLTTGWSLFIGSKRLRAGDSVLFIRYAIVTYCNFFKLYCFLQSILNAKFMYHVLLLQGMRNLSYWWVLGVQIVNKPHCLHQFYLLIVCTSVSLLLPLMLLPIEAHSQFSTIQGVFDSICIPPFLLPLSLFPFLLLRFPYLFLTPFSSVFLKSLPFRICHPFG